MKKQVPFIPKVRPPTPPLPTRAEVVGMLEQLIRGEVSRVQASDWATPWAVYGDDLPDESFVDKAVWEMLSVLYGADLPDLDGSYAYGLEDFQAWLEELLSSPVKPLF